MKYASYSDYTELYHGDKLNPQQFESLCHRAGEYLELLTYGRCGGTLAAPVKLAVTKACCAVADEIWRQESEPEIASHRVGDWSRTYVPEKNRERKIAEAARLQLHGTGLMWRGWKRGTLQE